MIPNSLFNRFPNTFQTRSIFDEMDDLFDDTWMDREMRSPLHGMLALAPIRQRHHDSGKRNERKPWAATVDLRGYRPDEIALKRDTVESDKEQHRILVHAKHEDGEDFAEIRKTILIPKTVDPEKVTTVVTKESVLVIKGPYNNQDKNVGTIQKRDDFQSVWDELQAIRNDMSSPYYGGLGADFIKPEIITNQDGTQKWQVKFNVDGLKPKDYTLKSEGNCVILEGKREAKSDHHHSSISVYESVNVPAGVNVDNLRSQLIDNKVIVLEAPYELAKKLESVKKIPIASETTTNGKLQKMDE